MSDERSWLSLPWKRPVGPPARHEAGPSPSWRETLRSRLFTCAIVFALWTTAIEARLLYLQVYQHDYMVARANDQQLRTLTTPAKRGELLDRNGEVLAKSLDAETITADPSVVADWDGLAQQVCAALTGCDASQQEAMTERLRRGGRFAYLARQVSTEDVRRVKALQLDGVGFIKESRRYYPNRQLAAHVLGYVGLDNQGLAGLEFAYDRRIRGRDGKLQLLTDARRKAMLTREDRPPTAGEAVELTIDQNLQYIAERELRAGVLENRAAGGTAIIMQPATGEVLALANYPTFNPNAFGQVDAADRRNRAVQELYEPGSTFKIVTASAALEEHVILPEDPVDCSPGYITFQGRPPIRDVHPNGVLPFTDVIVKSSNVGAIKVGMRVGAERLVRYISRFGFGKALAPDFRGENPGIVWGSQQLDASALASVSMGYQIGVTPMQMATAVSAIANGGSLVEPRVVRAFIRNGHREVVAPKTVGQAVAPETAATLTQIMEQVVERGTAKAAQIAGYTIAGKTGTAAKLVNRHYSKSDYNASFVGFVPSRKPALTIIVVIDSPHARGYFGGTVSAPVFQRIAEAALRHLGVAPNLNQPPPVLVARRDVQEDVAPRPAVAPMAIDGGVEATPPGVMPDVRGLSAREAVRALTRLGLVPQMTGAGFVLEQTPAPGAPLADGEACVVKLGRGPLAAAGGSQ